MVPLEDQQGTAKAKRAPRLKGGESWCLPVVEQIREEALRLQAPAQLAATWAVEGEPKQPKDKHKPKAQPPSSCPGYRFGRMCEGWTWKGERCKALGQLSQWGEELGRYCHAHEHQRIKRPRLIKLELPGPRVIRQGPRVINQGPFNIEEVRSGGAVVGYRVWWRGELQARVSLEEIERSKSYQRKFLWWDARRQTLIGGTR